MELSRVEMSNFGKFNEKLPPTSRYTDETIHFTDIYLKTTSKERDREREIHTQR